jgi:hypothetical protein
MRFRFSMRWLLLASVIVAACCYRLVLPTIIANRFVQAVASGNYERADACFADPDDQFLSNLNDKHWRFHARAELKPWSFRGSAFGKRLIQLHVAYHDAGPMRLYAFNVVVTRTGLLTPTQMMGFGFGGMGLAGTDLRSRCTTL